MRVLVLVFFVVSLSHCASYTDEIRDLRQDFLGGRYQASLDKLEKSSVRDSTRNRLLYHMEKAMILDRLGDLKGSRSLLLDADRIADELYTTSISKTAATFIYNESASDYSGEDYEKVAIHTLLAMSFLQDAKLAEGRVEAKKINDKLHEITQGYDPKYAHYKEDPYARFLSGLIYEAMQNWDDAIIDYKNALDIYSDSQYTPFYEGPVPEVLVSSLYGLAVRRNRNELRKDLKARFPAVIERYEQNVSEIPQGGDIVVLHEAGHIAIKMAKDFFIPIPGQVMRISFPYIDRKNLDWSSSSTGIRIIGRGSYTNAANCLNLNALAYQSLEDRRGRLIAKSMTRLIAKGVLTYQAEKQFGILGGLAANIYSVVTETADTRGWSLLPQAFYVNRVRVPVGRHNLEIKTAGRITDMPSFDIKNGEFKFIRSKG